MNTTYCLLRTRFVRKYAVRNTQYYKNVPLRDIVSTQIGLPVMLDNDTNLCAVGEHRFGAGRGTRHMVYLTFSTGYGIGIIIRLYVGHTGTAGEIRHAVITPAGGPPCTCGKKGCVMAYASGIGLSRMAYEQIAAGVPTLLGQTATPDRRRISGREIAAAADQGDQVAAEILHTAGTYCGVGLSVIVQVLTPELIVIGGGLTRIGTRLMEPALAAMREHAQPELWDSVRVVPWQLGDDLGILGAGAQGFAGAEGS